MPDENNDVQAGQVSLASLPLPSLFRASALDERIAFSRPFTQPPALAVFLETSLSSAAAKIDPILVSDKSEGGFRLRCPVPTLPVPVASRGSIAQAPLSEVAGRPAIAFSSGSRLIFSRSEDATGLRWGEGISVDRADVRTIALGSVAHHPAIAYRDDQGNLKFVRASDPEGQGWPAPTTIKAADTGGFAAGDLSFAEIAGRATILSWNARDKQISYWRAVDPAAERWPRSGIRVASGNRGISLAEIDGSPAFVYPWDNGRGSSHVDYRCGLNFIGASDPAGEIWPIAPPRTIYSAGPLHYPTKAKLLELDSKPAVFLELSVGGVRPQENLYFYRADDREGVRWRTRTEVTRGDFSFGGWDAAMVAGEPSAAWYEYDRSLLRYGWSRDGGAAFSQVTVFEGTSNSTPSIAEIEGRRALTFSTPEAQELRYIREGNGIPDTVLNWIAVGRT